MKRFPAFWRSRTTTIKLLGAFLIVMLPLYTLSIALTYYSSSQMQREVEQANESKLDFYYSHLQFELQRMTALVNEYAYDDVMSTFSARIPIMSNYDKSVQLNLIYAKLKQVKETSPYISDVVYYVPEINTRVSAVDGIRDVPEEEWRSLLNTMGNLNGTVSKYNDELYLLRSNPFILDQNTSPNFLLGIRLSTQVLKLKLEEFAAAGGSEITLRFGSKDGYILSSSGKIRNTKQDQMPVIRAGDPAIRRDDTGSSYDYSLYDQDNQFRLTASIPKSVLEKPIRMYSRWLWLLTGLSIVLIVVFFSWSYRTIHRPLTVLIRGFKKAEQGQTGFHIPHSRKDEFGYLYSRFNEMLKRLHVLIEENYVQRIRTSEAELKHLQSQITPHFLYNSLFNIKQMAEMENIELIKEFSDYLGRYFRYMTRDFAQEVSLGQEVEHALVYLSIQKIRFGSRIRTEIKDLDEAFASILVPRVLLQPFFENAFEHGFQKKSSAGILKMSYLCNGNSLAIVIEDNGDALTDKKLQELSVRLTGSSLENGEITGMINVNQRIRVKFGPEYGVQVARSGLGGLRATIKLPAGGDGVHAADADCR